MLVSMLKSKIAGAKVTQRELFYVGSITIDSLLMERAGIVENERVQIVNLNNGERLETCDHGGGRLWCHCTQRASGQESGAG